MYYTKVTGLSYTVNYLEKGTTNAVSPAKTVGKQTFETVIKSSDEIITVDGYKYDSASATSITIGTGSNVINLYYTKRTDLSYTVNYLEKDTNKVIHTVKTQGGKTFEDIVKSADEKIAIDGYNYDSASVTSITIGTGSNVINLYYTKRTDLSYKVNYLEKGTNKVIRTQKVKGGMTFQATVTSASEKVDINGYNYDSVSATSITIGTGSNVINFYYTKRTDLSYTVNYLEKDTNIVIHEQKVQEGMTFESTVTSSKEVITIDGYNYNSVDKETLTITTSSNAVSYTHLTLPTTPYV